GCY
ncbi:hypothetical protein D030_0752B, partial [Vibrio parahaemolyticus AQ3810]